VGYGNDGLLHILDGGSVTSFRGTVGVYNSERGSSEVTVSGAGSSWINTSLLTVAQNGDGSLRVSDGGFVSAGHLEVGHGDYVIEVDGLGSKLDIAGPARFYGVGRMDIRNSGEVSFNDSLDFTGLNESSAVLNLEGGRLRLNGHSILADEYGGAFVFNFTGGRLESVDSIDIDQPFVQQGGILAPGESIGRTDVAGDYYLVEGAVEIELGGTNNLHDSVNTTGNMDIALLGTTLDLPGIGPMSAGTYRVIESSDGTLAGQFEHVTGIAMYAGLVDVNYTLDAVTITLNWDYLPGDLNADGFVGIDDLSIILAHWNQSVATAVLSAGDISGDGFVGIDDLNAVLGNWNAGAPPKGETTSSIPEPTTALLMVGVVGALVQRRSSVLRG